MIESIDTSLIDWSRAQFAMTAMYHWIFVPLTLGLAVVMGIMETLYYKTGNEFWKKTAQFWMKLFGINFAIGVATGLILEFEFGTNWSNYSWFVGDIFGAPLAIEGILAFFMEATFIAVMFFGWGKVSKRFHLASTWLTGLGATISAWWILVANAWMQHPVGMEFNPDTVRNEMVDFWAVATSPVAVNKFFHTVLSGWVLGAIFVVGISCWYLLKKRNREFALASIKIGAIFGLVASLLSVWTGDGSGYQIAQTQPMKLAAMEGLNEGGKGAPFTLIGLTCTDPQLPSERMKTVKYGITIPKLLSFLGYHDFDAYVPGIQNIMDGYTSEDGKVYPSIEQRMTNGRLAIDALKTYKQAVKDKNDALASQSLQTLRANFRDFGYGYLSSPYDTIPPVPLVFYSFRLMVGLGMLFVLLFICSWWYAKKRKFEKFKFIPYLAIACVPLAYIASQCGWIVAEVGRQPWVVQNLMPTNVAITRIASGWVVTTFWMFAILFTLLLIAEIGIMFTQIRKGVKE